MLSLILAGTMPSFAARLGALWVVVAATSCSAVPNRNSVTTEDNRAADSLLTMAEPCSLVNAGIYLDGGSIGGALCDASGKTLEFCYDARCDRDEAPSSISRLWARHVLRRPRLDPSDPHLVFVGARYLTDSSAHPMAIGSVQEVSFARLLSAAVDRERSAAQADSLRGGVAAGTEGTRRRSTFAAASRLVRILEARAPGAEVNHEANR